VIHAPRDADSPPIDDLRCIAAVLLGAYCIAFLTLHRGSNVTFLERDTAGEIYLKTTRVYYFSAQPGRNVILYHLFYPVHCRASGDVANLQHRLWNKFDESSPPLSRQYYLENVQVLTRAGITVRPGRI